MKIIQSKTSAGIILVVLLKETIQVNTLNMYFDGNAASFMNKNENVVAMFVWTISFVYPEELESRVMTVLSLHFHRVFTAQ